MSSTARAFLLSARGPARAAAGRVLRRRFAEVGVAADPFEVTARLSRDPVDLLVASTTGWTRRHLAFLRAVRARGLARRVVVLVAPDRRRVAAAALAHGADAYLLEPVDLGELAALAQATTASPPPAPPADPADLPTFAAEVAHAVGNPLQVLSLLLEEGGRGTPDATRLALQTEVARLREVLAVVSAYARVTPPVRGPTDLDRLVAERVAVLSAAGWIAPEAEPEPAPTGPPHPVALDAGQVSRAVDGVLRFLASAAPTRPAPVRVRVRHGAAGRHEVAVRVRGFDLPEHAFEAARRSVLRLDDATRDPVPGLALADAVARGHGGRLERRGKPKGTVVALQLAGDGSAAPARPI